MSDEPDMISIEELIRILEGDSDSEEETKEDAGAVKTVKEEEGSGDEKQCQDGREVEKVHVASHDGDMTTLHLITAVFLLITYCMHSHQ